jgi:NitT/TauT family transport system ATP-binding protein
MATPPLPGREQAAQSGEVVAAAERSVKLSAVDLGVEYLIARTGQILRAIDSMTVSVRANEFVCVVGPSGCGKSTFLSVCAGLIPYSDGELTIDNQPVRGPGPDRAVVFQSAALLPWRTTMGNVTYGLDLRGVPKKVATVRAQAAIDLVGLRGQEDRYPHELSGGMQQRVNLARALTADPEILLLDEPFAALDAQTRELMQAELLRVWDATRKTTILVTHQIDEAVLLGDRVVVLSKGPESRIKEIVTIDLPRPRDESLRGGGRFADFVARIKRLIYDDTHPTNAAAR